MTKYFIFPNGSLKVIGKTLAEVVHPDILATFREVTRAEFYRIKTLENSMLAAAKAKSLYAATKRKAISVKDALKK